MAAPKSPPVEDAPPMIEWPEPVSVPPVVPVKPPQAPWTLAEAFNVLREALAAYYDAEDNMPAYLACQEAQMIHQNGGDVPQHPNCVQAWRMLVPLLEQALGQSLRIT